MNPRHGYLEHGMIQTDKGQEKKMAQYKHMRVIREEETHGNTAGMTQWKQN